MMRVALVGSGNMGAVLTGLLINAGHDVTVYDLDKEKAEALAASSGATARDTPLKVAQNADIILFSIPTYDDVVAFLKTDGVLAEMKGKDLLQISTGSPEEVHEFEKFLEGKDIGYLEGRIKNYPKAVGKPGSRIIYSGDQSMYDKFSPLLSSLSEHYELVSTNYEAASIYDLAVFPSSYGMIWGILLGAKLVKQHGYSVSLFADMIEGPVINTMRETIDRGLVDLDTGTYRPDPGTAATHRWAVGAVRVIEALEETNLDTDIFTSINDLLEKSIASGLGDNTIFSIAEFLEKK